MLKQRKSIILKYFWKNANMNRKNLIDDDLEKSSSDESDSEADNDFNDETECHDKKGNDEFKWTICWQYFNNNKSLIVYVNHALLDFYLRQSV